MDNFENDPQGYNKTQVNNFVEEVIKKTEHNVEMINYQQSEIRRLNEELAIYKRLEKGYDYVKQEAESNASEIKEIARKEAEIIIRDAKDNANKIVNDALVRSDRVERQKEELQKTMNNYKKEIRRTLLTQLEKIEEIEIL